MEIDIGYEQQHGLWKLSCENDESFCINIAQERWFVKIFLPEIDSKIKFMADLYSDKNAFSSLWYDENKKKRDDFRVCNLGTDDDSGKMLFLRKETDRNWVSSLSDNFSYVSHDNRKQKDMKKPRAYLK